MIKLDPKWITKNEHTRLYQLPVPIIGLTGGIATGKSSVALLFQAIGISVIDADALVRNIYQLPSTKAFIKEKFSTAVESDQIQFKKLREIVFNNPNQKIVLENFIYQYLPNEFLRTFKNLGSPSLVVYDVPLLYEKKLNEFVDLTICVYAPASVQLKRLITRDKSSDALAQSIINQQLDIEEKKKMSDFVLDNSNSPEELNKQFKQLTKFLFLED